MNVYQKTIKTLLAKLNDLDSKQQAELMRMHLEDDEKEREKAEGLRERDGLEAGLAETNAQLLAAHDEVARIRQALHAVEGRYANVLTLQNEAVKFTLQCLLDMQARPLSDEQSRDSSEPLSLQTLDLDKREQVMQYILDQLRAYQEQLKELQLHNAWKQHNATLAHDGGGVTLPPIPHSGAGASSALWTAPPPPPSFAADAGLMGGDRHGEPGVTISVQSPLRDGRAYGKRVVRSTRA